MGRTLPCTRDRLRLALTCSGAKLSTPDLAAARRVAEGDAGVQLFAVVQPEEKLDSHAVARFQRELGAMGYKFQFGTPAGFHSLNHAMFQLARDYNGAWDGRVRGVAGGGVRGGAVRIRRPSISPRGADWLLSMR